MKNHTLKKPYKNQNGKTPDAINKPNKIVEEARVLALLAGHVAFPMKFHRESRRCYL
jgi:hypothetical protein